LVLAALLIVSAGCGAPTDVAVELDPALDFSAREK